MTGVRKAEGIEMLLRTMGPSCIAMDEITAPEDAAALMQAAGCGVELLATVHAGSIRDFFRNSTYQALKESGIFEVCLVLNRRQTYTVERMEAICCG